MSASGSNAAEPFGGGADFCPSLSKGLWPAASCAALKGRTHGCTDQGCCKREESSCQLGAVHTWHCLKSVISKGERNMLVRKSQILYVGRAVCSGHQTIVPSVERYVGLAVHSSPELLFCRVWSKVLGCSEGRS
jgi:hypothetical protein